MNYPLSTMFPFVFSDAQPEPHGTEPTVMYMFPSREARILFEKNMHVRQADENGIKDDNNAGAIYKLKAVLQDDGNYMGLVRCGVTGALVFSSYNLSCNIEGALYSAFCEIQSSMNRSNATFSSAVQDLREEPVTPL